MAGVDLDHDCSDKTSGLPTGSGLVDSTDQRPCILSPASIARLLSAAPSSAAVHSVRAPNNPVNAIHAAPSSDAIASSGAGSRVGCAESKGAEGACGDIKDAEAEADPLLAVFTCAVCLDVPTLERAVATPCGHVFCAPCLDEWLHVPSSRDSCPTCRSAVASKTARPLGEHVLLRRVFSVWCGSQAERRGASAGAHSDLVWRVLPLLTDRVPVAVRLPAGAPVAELLTRRGARLTVRVAHDGQILALDASLTPALHARSSKLVLARGGAKPDASHCT